MADDYCVNRYQTDADITETIKTVLLSHKEITTIYVSSISYG